MSENAVLDQWASGGSEGGLRGGARACAKKNLLGNGTTTVKVSGGALHCIQVNTRASGGTATIYDSLSGSGTVMAVIDTGFTNSSSNTLFYDAAFQTGLTVVTANAAALDLMVAYQ